MRFGLVALLLFLSPLVTFATPENGNVKKPVALMSYPFEFSNHNHAPHFEKTLIFGHSISSNLLAHVGLGIEYGPGDILSKVYAGKPVYKNIAKGAGNFQWDELGLGRLMAILGRGGSKNQAKLQKAYNEATAIIGIDAFYMGVVFNQCSDLENNGYRVNWIIDQFTEKAFRDGKVTILGNMPDEKFSTMPWYTRLAITSQLDSGWKGCMFRVNKALKNYCKPDRNCYVVDLKTIVANMHANNGHSIRSQPNKKYSYDELRPDGANLGTPGVQLIIEEILHSLKEAPPRSPNPTNTID